MAQIKRKLKEIPISWTKEEIMEAYGEYDRNIQYEELWHPFTDIMKDKFKETNALLKMGKGRGYYIVSKDRLRKYCQVIRAIFNMEKRALERKRYVFQRQSYGKEFMAFCRMKKRKRKYLTYQIYGKNCYL